MTVPPNKERYRPAMDLAWRSLQAKDPESTARFSGAKLVRQSLLVPFFESGLRVDLDDKTVLIDSEPADDMTTILTLHYLVGCGEEGPRGELVPFNQAEGGDGYFQAFKLRAIDRLAQEFGRDPPGLALAGAKINGRDMRLGSSAVVIHVFPKLVVVAIVWEGDEEIPASANLLFDSVSLRILPTEDLAVVGSLVVSRLVKAKG